jgi:hypothetical protein
MAGSLSGPGTSADHRQQNATRRVGAKGGAGPAPIGYNASVGGAEGGT